MNRQFAAKMTVLVGALLVATVLTIVKPAPMGLGAFAVGPAEARPAPGAAASEKSHYDLTKLAVVNTTLARVRDTYVDPTRIDAKEMLYAALDGVQRNVAEVLVEPRKDKDEVLITVNDKSQTFTLSDVDSPWTLSSKLKSVFRFVQANINPNTDPVEIEYAAVNGMLGTLDPHSILLDPEDAREMDISTQGKFGGIGITIGMRKHKKTGKDTLTVLNLIGPDVPAARAGLKAGDYIIKINDEPTENLTLNEAMGRLRGDPQTKVVVTVERGGVDAPMVFPIVRDQIKVSSVSGRLLKGGVGYLKIENFAYETSRDLRAKVAELKKQGAKAWVLDLRWNPGGLLDQAIKVSDLFLESGTIVTTVGKAGKEREEKRAVAADTEGGPLVVLVNGGSASASEIVAGALKNLNRAVIIGQTTFGKGSVQVLYDNDDGSKLKLTIAQYLTPGDVSIQGVGITPDIELTPARVPSEPIKNEKEWVRLVYRNLTKEADLDAHLTSKNARAGDKPSETMKYLMEPAKRAEGDEPLAPGQEEEPDPLDSFREDFEMRFARDYVASMSSNRRTDMLKAGKKYVADKRVEEDGRIGAALGKLGLDWTVGKNEAGKKPKLVATFTTDKADNKVGAGQVVAITGTVVNNGDGTAYQVHASAESDDWSFEGTELVFGKIAPGETRTFTSYVKVDKDTPSRVDTLDWKFTEAGGATVEAKPLKLTLNGLAHPQFAYTYQLIDDGGNGDGQLQLGESFRLLVNVKNVGPGAAEKISASLRNASGDGVAMNKVRFESEKLAAGETRSFEFTFDVKKDFAQKELVIELVVYDPELREGLTEKLKWNVASPGAGPEAASGVVKLKKETPVLAGAAEGAAVIGTAKKGASFRVRARDAQWVKLEVEPGRPGFVPAAAVANAGGNPSNAFSATWQVTPPAVNVAQAALETAGEKYRLKGSVVDDGHVEDVFVIVSNRQAKIEGRKVFYKSNRGARDGKRMDFDAEIPVWAGNNMITVVARENDEVRTVQTYYVYRTDGKKSAVSKNHGK